MNQKEREKNVQEIVKYLGLSGTVTGIPGTIYLFVSGQPQAALISGLLTVGVTLAAIAYKFVSGVINRVLDKIEAELADLEEPIATWIINQGKTTLIKAWWRLNPQFQRKYYESLIDSFCNLDVEGYRIGLPALDLEKVFVSLRVKTQNLERVSGVMISSSGEGENGLIWDFLRQSSQKQFQSYRRLAVIGSPGSGKTTLLKHLTLIYAKKHYKKYQAPKFIPILLYLRDIRHRIITEKPPNLPELIREQIQKLPANPPLTLPPHWLEDQLKIGNCLVMFDGLDEVANPEEREQVSAWVNKQMKSYGKTAFIVTSRPYGYRSAPVERVTTVLEVLPFNPEEMEQFIKSLYLQNEILRTRRDTPSVHSDAENLARDLIQRIKAKRAIADMAKNPLLVTMIATVHYCGSALPGRRVELYQKICELLLGARQQAKRIEIPLTGEQNKSVLQVLALALMQKPTREFRLAEGINLIQGELERVAGNILTPEAFLKNIKDVSGLLVERELGDYELAHLSFQEYLAACEVKELQQEAILTTKLEDTWWSETIRLYAAQNDATNLINKAIENPTVNTLTLALDCLEESLKVEPATRRKLDEILEAGLESANRDIFKLAAEVKLLRRLNNLLEIEENLEIDSYYLTNGEYQLFINEWLPESRYFTPGTAKMPVTQISRYDALAFCAWLTEKAPLLTGKTSNNPSSFYYRLLTAEEAKNHPARESQHFGCQMMEGNHSQQGGIRLVKTSIPCLFAFDVVTVNSQGLEIQRQRRWNEYFRENLPNSVTLEMVAIPGGTFWMGSPEGEGYRNEKPQHQVTVSPFYMGKYPVTQAQWKAIALTPKIDIELKPEPSSFKGNDNHSVECVSWNQAVEYCKRLSRETGKEYRLPSEAEWEYACRSVNSYQLSVISEELTVREWRVAESEYEIVPESSETSFKIRQNHTVIKQRREWNEKYNKPFHFGETITGKLANYCARETYAEEANGEYRRKTTPIGQFPPNGFGLYDMHGNVWEWCLDDYHDNYENAPIDGRAWIDIDNDNRSQNKSSIKILRGGSWFRNPHRCRSAYRNNISFDYYINNIGFRVGCFFF